MNTPDNMNNMPPEDFGWLDDTALLPPTEERFQEMRTLYDPNFLSQHHDTSSWERIESNFDIETNDLLSFDTTLDLQGNVDCTHLTDAEHAFLNGGAEYIHDTEVPEDIWPELSDVDNADSFVMNPASVAPVPVPQEVVEQSVLVDETCSASEAEAGAEAKAEADALQGPAGSRALDAGLQLPDSTRDVSAATLPIPVATDHGISHFALDDLTQTFQSGQAHVGSEARISQEHTLRPGLIWQWPSIDTTGVAGLGRDGTSALCEWEFFVGRRRLPLLRALNRILSTGGPAQVPPVLWTVAVVVVSIGLTHPEGEAFKQWMPQILQNLHLLMSGSGLPYDEPIDMADVDRMGQLFQEARLAQGRLNMFWGPLGGLPTWVTHLEALWRERTNSLDWLMKGLLRGFARREHLNEGMNFEAFWTRRPRIRAEFDEVELDQPALSVGEYLHRVLVALVVESVQCSVFNAESNGWEEWEGHTSRVQRESDADARRRVVGRRVARHSQQPGRVQNQTDVVSVPPQIAWTSVSTQASPAPPPTCPTIGRVILTPGQSFTNVFHRDLWFRWQKAELSSWQDPLRGVVWLSMEPTYMFFNKYDRDVYFQWHLSDVAPSELTGPGPNNWPLQDNSVHLKSNVGATKEETGPRKRRRNDDEPDEESRKRRRGER